MHRSQYNQLNLGAVGDGKTLDTVAIQNALDACGAKEDGGIIEFEGGKTYLSGSLQIGSKITLKLPKKSVLKASSQVFFVASFNTPNPKQDIFLRGTRLIKIS